MVLCAIYFSANSFVRCVTPSVMTGIGLTVVCPAAFMFLKPLL